MSNNYRVLNVKNTWWNYSFTHRIPFPVRETLGVNHNTFNVRLYVDIPQSIDIDKLIGIEE